MKICSAHQPAFLPWLGLIHKVMTSDVFIIMDVAKFRKRAFMHRNKIEINEKVNYLGLRLDSDSDYKTCDLLNLNSNSIEDLKEMHGKVEHTYAKSKFKNQALDFFEETVVNTSNYKFNEICLNQLKYICKKLSIETKIILESEFLSKEKIEGMNVSERLLSHALNTGSQVYITGVNSINYLDTDVFKKNRIFHLVQKFNYEIFYNLQKCKDPLSIIHQIAHIGFDNISNLMLEKQINKKEILNSLK